MVSDEASKPTWCAYCKREGVTLVRVQCLTGSELVKDDAWACSTCLEDLAKDWAFLRPADGLEPLRRARALTAELEAKEAMSGEADKPIEWRATGKSWDAGVGGWAEVAEDWESGRYVWSVGKGAEAANGLEDSIEDAKARALEVLATLKHGTMKSRGEGSNLHGGEGQR